MKLSVRVVAEIEALLKAALVTVNSLESRVPSGATISPLKAQTRVEGPLARGSVGVRAFASMRE